MKSGEDLTADLWVFLADCEVKDLQQNDSFEMTTDEVNGIPVAFTRELLKNNGTLHV